MFHEYLIKSDLQPSFSASGPSDLLFDPRWPLFKLTGDFMDTNVLTKFHEDLIKTVMVITVLMFSDFLTQ